MLFVYINVEHWRREDYIKCKLISGVAPKHYTFSNLFTFAVHRIYQCMQYILLFLTVVMYTMLSTKQNTSYFIFIVDSTHVQSTTASLEDL